MSERFLTRQAVFLIVKNEKGEILLSRRGQNAGGYLIGYYDFAASGHVDPGESIRAAAVRELREEVGLAANESDLKLVHINQNFIDYPYTNYTFIVEKWLGEPKICEPDKCDDLQWFDPGGLPKKCTLNVRLNKREGFSQDLTWSYLTEKEYTEVMGEAP